MLGLINAAHHTLLVENEEMNDTANVYTAIKASSPDAASNTVGAFIETKSGTRLHSSQNSLINRYEIWAGRGELTR